MIDEELYKRAYTILINEKVSELTAKRVISSIKDWDNELLFTAYNLGGVDDCYGHTYDKHIKVEKRYLEQRAAHMPYSVLHPCGATRFYSTEISEIVDLIRTAMFDTHNLIRFANFLRSGYEDKAILEFEFQQPVGEGIYAGAEFGKLYSVSGLVIIIKRHRTQLFRIHTAYPCATLAEGRAIGEVINTYHSWVLQKETAEKGIRRQRS